MMNEHTIINSRLWQYGGKLLAAALGFALITATPLQAAEPAMVEAAKAEPAKTTPVKKPVKTTAKKKQATVPGVTAQASLVPPASTIEFAPQVGVTVGKSTLLKLPAPATRISVGNPAVADVILLNPSEVYLLGKTVGATNVILWSKSGHSTVVDVIVGMDIAALQGKLQQLLPGEKNIRVASAADSVVLSGTVTDAVKVDRAVALAEAYGGKKVVNLMSVGSVQQVMLEVKIAEINRTMAEKLGVRFGLSHIGMGDSISWAIASKFLSNPLVRDVSTTTVAGGTTTSVSLPNQYVVGPGMITGTKPGATSKLIDIDAEKGDGLIKILAEPNIVALSGQEGSFLAGGEIMIPVMQPNGGVSLESKQFGVGLKFTPTVLEDGRIHIRVLPEVTDLVGFTNVASTSLGGSILVPTLTTRRISTAVELREGQSLAIGGLLSDNFRENVSRFPLLGEIPILGALFRSSEFQKNKTELLVVVTPRLVKPLAPNYALPTDSFKEPSRSEFFFEGKMEATAKDESQPAAPAAETKESAPATGGFQMK